ncbi:Transamidase GatB domain protein [Paramagnetospirillum magnetotacticum MS-1]|uniref:Transamidase GatB domain protein n=2 Tax=Paramagnetospirillum magnetotacticum TaxID=188 RepID=A0A0C2YNV0_PARME|nr:Transamidase GatB domain protein [Paramagnetospirillum magnetotacticum MS-1]
MRFPKRGVAMLRQQLNDALKAAMLGKDARTVSTVRLILAALKDRDIAARPKGLADGIGDDEIRQMLQSMIKQRRESIALYEQGNRPELAKQEADEITVIEKFLPRQMGEAEITDAVKAAIAACGATGIKDMGKVMAALKASHAGTMDFSKAGAVVKKELGG